MKNQLISSLKLFDQSFILIALEIIKIKLRNFLTINNKVRWDWKKSKN